MGVFEWRVTSQYIGGEKMYAVYRLRNVSEVDHSGNREYRTGYMTDEADAQAICDRLNNDEGDL